MLCICTWRCRLLLQSSRHILCHIASPLLPACCRRTLKFLMAILAGKWVVDEAWVEACLRQGCAVDEAAYQVRAHPQPQPDTTLHG